MPVYRQTYRSYDGGFRRRLRWAIVVKHEVKLLLKSRPFLVLMLFATLHVVLRVLQVVSYDIVMQNPNNPLTPVLRQMAQLTVSEATLFDFIRLQGSLVFVVCLTIGSGMICNDLKNNLLEVYFAKPISWRDYALGKIMTLVLIGLTMTALPSVLLVVLHNLLVPGMETLRESYWWPFSAVCYSVVLVTPCALAVLASSAVLHSERFAAVVVVMILIADSVMAGLLSQLLHNRDYLIAAMPLALNRIGETLFVSHRKSFDIPWHWSLLFVGVVSLVALWVLCRRIRRAEVAV